MTKLPRVSASAALRWATMLTVAAVSASGKAAPPQPAQATQTETPDRASAYYHYGLASLYEEMAVNGGRADYATQAVEQYKLAINADPSSTLLQDGLAALYFKIGRIKEAVAAAQEQVKLHPDDVDAHTLLGQVYLRSLDNMQGSQSGQMLSMAIGEYEIIARLKPDDVETKLLLGQLYSLNHDSARAEQQFKQAQALDGSSEEVVLQMARLYGEEGDTQRAVQMLQSVPAADRTARMELALGAGQEQLKNYREAAAAYRRSLDIDPDNPDAQRALANALMEDDELPEALKVLQQLAAADPNDAATEIRIADVLRRQGQYQQALDELERAKQHASDGAAIELTYNEALVYDALGRYDDATAALTGLLAQTAHADGQYSDDDKRNRAIFLNRLAAIDREQNKTAEAVAAYKQIADLGGEYAKDGYGGEVDAYRDGHQWKEALAAAESAARTLPKDHAIQMVYAQQLIDNGSVEQGLALAKAQLTGGPEDLDTHERLAEIYIRLKRFKEADAQLNAASAMTTKPDDKLYAYFLRGEYFDRQKMYDQAEEQFRKALAIDPQNAAVLNYLGYMLADRGERLPEATKLIRQAVALDPQNPAYLDSLGWVYFKSGDYGQAEENLRKANERSSTDPTMHDHLGEVYAKTGRLKQAVAQWERSMAEYGHSLPADADPEDVQKVEHKLENARVKLAKLTPAEK